MATQQKLQTFLARNELAELIAELRLICLQAPNDQYGNELVQLVSQYNTYLKNEDKLYAADRDVALAKIKNSFSNFIELLDIPKGEAPTVGWVNRQRKNAFEQIVQSPWRWSLVIVFLSLMILLISQTHVQHTDFKLIARVKKIGLLPAQKWTIGAGYELILTRFELENADFIPTLPSWPPQNAFVSLYDGRIQLNVLPIEAGQAITLNADKQELFLQLATGRTNVQLDLQGAHLSLPEFGLDTLLGDPETGDESITLQSSLTPKLWLSTSESQTLSLPKLLVDSIDFNYKVEIDTDEKTDSSSLLSGSIQVNQHTYILSKGSALYLEGLENAMLEEIKLLNGGFDIILSGKVRHLQNTYLGQDHNLMPSWLQYFRQNQAFLFYFSSFCALCAVLLPIRVWFVKPRK